LVLILHFGLCTDEERPALEAKLAELIASFGGLMSTGFVGTPYLLHVLTAAGRDDLAYQLLFEERNPSWLYSVVHGATTMWEHWNSLKEDGSFWSRSMNSFNHYAYGSVCDWIYGVAAGITVSEDGVGYRKFTLTPHPDRRLGHVNCRLNTVAGEVVSNWYYSENFVHYEFTVPFGSVAEMTLPDGRCATLGAGTYHFTTKA
jgi:alpha-L-rhamnosidase